MLTKEQIFAARDLATEDVDVPEWGGAVRITVMSGRAREALMDALAEPQKTSRFQALMLSSTIVDDAGAPVFTADDVEQLREKNTDVLTRLVEVAMRLNKIGAKSTEEAEKNSEAAQSGSSGSDSLAS
jgi:phage terminase large subunit-like protein